MKKFTLFFLLFALGCSKSDDTSWKNNVSDVSYAANSLAIMGLKGDVSLINEGVPGALKVYKFNDKGMITSVIAPDTLFCARYDSQGRIAYFRTQNIEKAIKYSNHDKYIFIGNEIQAYLPIFAKGVSEILSITTAGTRTKKYDGEKITLTGGTTLEGTIAFKGNFPAKEAYNAFNYIEFEYAPQTGNIITISSSIDNVSENNIYKDNKYNSLSESTYSVGTTNMTTTNVYNEDGSLARWKKTVSNGDNITSEGITTYQYTAHDHNGNWTDIIIRTTSSSGEVSVKRNYIYR